MNRRSHIRRRRVVAGDAATAGECFGTRAWRARVGGIALAAVRPMLAAAAAPRSHGAVPGAGGSMPARNGSVAMRKRRMRCFLTLWVASVGLATLAAGAFVTARAQRDPVEASAPRAAATAAPLAASSSPVR